MVCYGIFWSGQFSRMDSLPNFLTHGAPLRARESSAARARELRYKLNVVICKQGVYINRLITKGFRGAKFEF